MTLTKAIEAAREYGNGALKCSRGSYQKDNYIKKALAALPDKPMTEDEIIKYCHEKIDGKIDLSDLPDIIHALKSANVLFMREE